MTVGGVIMSHVHHPRRHSAIRTNHYLYSQLIPYIGNKRKLLPLIAHAIEATGQQHGTFVDLFTGSTVVARLAKRLGYRVVANDWEPYSYEIACATVALNRPPPFAALGGPSRVFATLNSLPPVYGYIAHHLCPEDDDEPDPEHERMFFTQCNGRRIDAIREQVAAWEQAGLVSSDERAYVLSALVYAVSYVSNTSGVFKGFHYGWGGKTSTALYRILSTLTLREPILYDNRQDNLALREDAQALGGELRARLGNRPEIVYLDPPYNQHPYGSNYHVLNTVVLWDKPRVARSIRINGRKVDKSAIRKDWRTERRSPYNSAREAVAAFEELVGSVDARWLLLSYSTDGNMPLESVLRMMAARGTLKVFTRPYKRYRVSTPRMSPKSHNVEFVAMVDTQGRPSLSSVSRLANDIETQEREALAKAGSDSRSQLPLFSLE